MKTKKLILGLAFILSALTTMSFTYCEKGHVRGNSATYKSSLSQSVLFTSSSIASNVTGNSHYSENLQNLASTVQNYLQNNLKNLTDSVVVNKNFTEISIYVKSRHESAVEAKLMELNSRNSELDELIKKNAPEVVTAQFTLCNTDEPEDLLNYNYNK